jgi:hypothetical protein
VAIQVYIVPLILGGRSNHRFPKYFPYPHQFNWSLLDYGLHDIAVIWANINPATDTILQAASDVHAFPVNLDTNLGAGILTALKTKLESNFNVPMDRFTIANTWRDILRVTWRAFKFGCVHHAQTGGKIFTTGVTLDSTFSSLPVAARQRLLATANFLNLNTSTLSGSSTLRQIMNAISDQIPITGIKHLGQTL